MNKKLFIALLSFIITGTVCYGQDPVFNTLQTELDRNFEVYKQQAIPAYYILLRMDEIQSANCVARFGKLHTGIEVDPPLRAISSSMRVGSPELDNTHEIRNSDYGSRRNDRIEADRTTVDNNPLAIKRMIWSQLDNLYKENIQLLEQIKANVTVKVKTEDQSPDFTQEKAEQYYEQAIPWESLGIDANTWNDKVRKYSAVFSNNKDVLEGVAVFYATLSREYLVDTEGREIAQNRTSVHLVLSANALADDGMFLPLNQTWTAASLNELPSDEEVMKAAQEMSNMLSALKKAPIAESFTGPAILSPEASGVFFHEIFGHRVEGSRLKNESDAQTFKKKIGETVLPKHLSVTFDPTMRKYRDTSLSGYYTFDDEGIRGQRVEVIQQGKLCDFLMSRTPIDGFAHSNGHGRAALGNSPVTRQSNMLVESSQKLSDEDLRKMLRKEAKSQGKEFAYYFKEVSGGFTNTSRFSPNSFNVTPLVVYRVYVDGRPDELVRGVDMVGTPLAMFSQIEACGTDYAVFNGTCGAESGGVPVSCVAPAMFVKRIETQKRPKSQTQPPLLPMPVADKKTTNDQETAIYTAMKEEVDRSLDGLKIEGMQRPFFISYNIMDGKQLNISATLGSLTSSVYSPSRGSGSRLLIGDYQCTDENFRGSTGGSSGFDGSPCLDNDVEGIRYTIWRDLDAIYKNAAETYEQKQSAIKQLNIPEKDLELPDWDKTTPIKLTNLPVTPVDFDRTKYEDFAKQASAVFADYPEILQSDVSLSIHSSKDYYYNTEQSEYIIPSTYVSVEATILGKTDEGENLVISFDHAYDNPKDLLSLNDMKKECRELAGKLIAQLKAPKMDEAYSGPVLFEGLAVVKTAFTNFMYGEQSLIAQRKPLTPSGFSYGGNSLEEMMNKRITAREITIEDLSGTKEYKGTRLFGYTPVDAQGVVPPAKLTLVENGILKTLLSDRVPSPKVPHSNGHSIGSRIGSGVFHLIDTRTQPEKDLRKELLERAKEEGYEYAYIIRDINGNDPVELYQVSVADGSEKVIRSATVNLLDSQSFKKILGVSDKEQIYNGSAGHLVSIIVPQSILFEELEIQSDRVDNFQKPPFVKAPVK